MTTNPLLFKLIFLGLTSTALADVNLQQASYFKTWTDFTVESKNIRYSFQRTYRSRSIHQGLLGFGWCTDFEKSLDLRKNSQITLTDCQEDRSLIFRKHGNDYVSVLNSKDKVIVQNGHFQRQKGLIKQIFDSEGRLIELRYLKWPLEIFYGPDQKISRIKINQDKIIDLKFTPKDGDSLTVMAPGKAAFVYHLKDKNLISVSVTGGLKTVFDYNSFHNLIRISQGSKTIERMSYENSKDWLIETSTDSVCKETYSYQSDAKKPMLFKTIVQKFCDSELQSETQWTYELQETQGSAYRISRTFSRKQNLNPRLALKNGAADE